MKKVLSVIVMALASASVSAQSPTTSIFGMTAGEAIPYPTCGKRPHTAICKQMFNTRDGVWVEYFINYPSDQSPEMVSSNIVSVKTVDDKIVAFRFETLGVRSQDYDIERLSKKFGKPESVTKVPMKTLAGGSFDATLAKWSVNGLTVVLDSMGYGLDGGKVEIYTPLGMEIQNKLDAAEESKRVAL